MWIDANESGSLLGNWLASPFDQGMKTMHVYRLNCIALFWVCLFLGTAQGQSLGRWRMPSTPAQFFGYGYGPGHHAPMVRMPCQRPAYVNRTVVVPTCRQPYCYDASNFSAGPPIQGPCSGGCGAKQAAPQQVFTSPAIQPKISPEQISEPAVEPLPVPKQKP